MVKPVFKATKSKSESVSFSVEFSADDMIFEEGTLGTEMYIVQQGKVAILKQFKGTEQQLALLGQGDFFGEMSVLEDLPRTATARAASDCRLLEINGSTFDQMLRKNPEIAVRMMRKLSRRLRETDLRLREALGSEESQAPEMPTAEGPSQRRTGPEKLVHDLSSIEFFIAAGKRPRSAGAIR